MRPRLSVSARSRTFWSGCRKPEACRGLSCGLRRSFPQRPGRRRLFPRRPSAHWHRRQACRFPRSSSGLSHWHRPELSPRRRPNLRRLRLLRVSISRRRHLFLPLRASLWNPLRPFLRLRASFWNRRRPFLRLRASVPSAPASFLFRRRPLLARRPFPHRLRPSAHRVPS